MANSRWSPTLPIRMRLIRVKRRAVHEVGSPKIFHLKLLVSIDRRDQSIESRTAARKQRLSHCGWSSKKQLFFRHSPSSECWWRAAVRMVTPTMILSTKLLKLSVTSNRSKQFGILEKHLVHLSRSDEKRLSTGEAHRECQLKWHHTVRSYSKLFDWSCSVGVTLLQLLEVTLSKLLYDDESLSKWLCWSSVQVHSRFRVNQGESTYSVVNLGNLL